MDFPWGQLLKTGLFVFTFAGATTLARQKSLPLSVDCQRNGTVKGGYQVVLTGLGNVIRTNGSCCDNDQIGRIVCKHISLNRELKFMDSLYHSNFFGMEFGLQEVPR